MLILLIGLTFAGILALTIIFMAGASSEDQPRPINNKQLYDANELSSLHIVKMMEMANKRVENAVERIEDKTQGIVLTPFGKFVCGVVLAFFLWLATM